jgi:tetratricopeptide (TPR) repeat protein
MSKERYVSPYHLALIYCYLKENEKAVEHLQNALDVADPWLTWMSVEPVLDSLRGDERFRYIQEQTGYRALFDTAADPTTEPTLPQEQPIHDLTTIVIDESHITSSGVTQSFRTQPKSFVYGAIALLLLALSIPAIYFYQTRTGAEPSRTVLQQMPFQAPSVLILPFRSDESDIGAGMADALVQKLGAIKGLSVISASTGRSVANIDPDQLFKELGIPFVLRGELSDTPEGPVLKADFINATDNSLLWSESFEARNGDYFALQSQAAEKIWKTFNLDLSPTELRQAQRSYTEDPIAYTQYLIGRSQMAFRTAEGLRNAITSFSEAIRLDASFASAYVGLADAYALLNLYDRNPPENAYPMAKDFAKRALAIDDSLGEAHASMAYINFYHDRDRAAAELEFRRAIQMSPSYAQAHHWFALVLASTNKPVDAISEIQIAERLDPRSLSIKAASGIVHFFAGNNDGALEVCDRALALQPNFLPALKVKRWVYAFQGNWSEARRYFQMERSAANGKPEDAGWIIIESQLVSTDPENNAAALKRLDEAAGTPFIKANDFYYSFEIALAYHHLGQTQKALEYIERSESSASHSFNLVEADPRIAYLRKEPRYLKVVSKLHKTE